MTIMALLGIYGPHAVGKTSAVDRLLGKLEETDLPVTCVRADSGLEFKWVGGALEKDSSRREEYWRGKRARKDALLDELMADDTRLYVVESARFFSGLQSHIAYLHSIYGGAEFIILTISDVNAFDQFLRDRAANSVRATYNADFWMHNKLRGEGYNKYANYLPPVFSNCGLPYHMYDVGSDRNVWYAIDNLIWELVNKPLGDWYT